jgi:predicted AlkP superfamily pyrophosphatase or phosphodiesterase
MWTTNRWRGRVGPMVGLLLALWGTGIAQPTSVRMEHVVLIGVDGMGAEGVVRVDPPTLRALQEKGVWSRKARAVIPTVSAPNWASMIMGAGPAQHGVTSNDWRVNQFEIAPTCRDEGGYFPTIFRLLRAQRPSARIAVIHEWKGLAHLFPASDIDTLRQLPDHRETMRQAIEVLVEEKPTLMMIHLDHVDHAGHSNGWHSNSYDEAIREADRLIEQLLDRLRRVGMLDRTAILVTADHGGKEKKHGGLTMGEIEIPWILMGPGLATGEIPRPVNTYDTAATIADLLGLRAPDCWIGQSVLRMTEVNSGGRR